MTVASPGWAGTAEARRSLLSYLPLSDRDPEPPYAVADAWAPPSPMALDDALCARVVDVAGRCEGVELSRGVGVSFADLPLSTADRDAIIARFRAANALWWRFPVRTWRLGVKRYAPGDAHPVHQDLHPGGAARQRIAGMVQLSAGGDYTGGDLLVHFAHHRIVTPRDRGTVIAMPAWTLHEVTPITSGTRWVLLVNADI